MESLPEPQFKQAFDNTETPEEPKFITPKKQIVQKANWINDITMPFILSWEGKIVDNNGDHVLYDDDVHVGLKEKRRWNGKGRTSWN